MFANSSSHKQITIAMAIMAIAMLLIPAMDILAKLLATKFDMAPASIAFSRFTIQTVLMFTLLFARNRTIVFKVNNPGFNIMRGMLIGAASMIFFISVKYMPVADAIAIFFVEPLIVMFLSSAFLGETLGWRRVGAAIVGFGGAILVIQPSFEQFGPVSLLPLVTAVLFSFYLILTRKYGAEGNAMGMQLYSGLGGVMFCSAALAFGELTGVTDLQVSIPTTAEAVVWLITIGIIATLSHLLIVIAFTMANASTLAPFQYLEIVSATVLGFLVFGDLPNAIKWLGTAIIIASGMFIFWRERHIVKNRP